MRSKKSKQRREDNSEGIFDNQQIEFERLEFALNIMERIDAWINRCDNKISILLGVCGVELTVFITSASIGKAYSFIYNIAFYMSDTRAFIFISACLITGFSYVKAIYHVINSMVAQIDGEKYQQETLRLPSNLFFGDISSRQYKDYKNDFIMSTTDERLDDILSQIYINSNIANIKYKHYNKSLLWVGISAITTFVLVIFGKVAF